MKKQLIAILTVVVLFISYSCHEKIPMTYAEGDVKLLVDGSINTDTIAHYVRLTETGNVSGGKVLPVINATVTISDGDTVFILKESSKIRGLYATDPTVYGVPGKTYTLNISNVDINNDDVMEKYSAKCELRANGRIDSLEVRRQVYSPTYKGWVVNMAAQDFGGKNFYLVKAYKNGILLTDSLYEFTNLTDNTSFEGKAYPLTPVYFLNESKTDEKIHGADSVVNVQNGDTTYIKRPADVLTIEMEGITEEYFRFLYEYIQEYNPKLPIFSGPSANVSTNIQPSNKACGFFSAYSAVRKSIIVK
jgi:hypothetical protein